MGEIKMKSIKDQKKMLKTKSGMIEKRRAYYKLVPYSEKEKISNVSAKDIKKAIFEDDVWIACLMKPDNLDFADVEAKIRNYRDSSKKITHGYIDYTVYYNAINEASFLNDDFDTPREFYFNMYMLTPLITRIDAKTYLIKVFADKKALDGYDTYLDFEKDLMSTKFFDEEASRID